MTANQARTLGSFIARVRRSRGLAATDLAIAIGAADGWISGIEQGRFLDPAPDRLVRIADVLEIDPARIDRITRGSVAQGLPRMRTYFRAKYDLSPEQIAEVERYIDGLQGRSGGSL